MIRHDPHPTAPTFTPAQVAVWRDVVEALEVACGEELRAA